MGTTALGLRYPDPGSNVELWTHIQNLAEDVDDAITDVGGVLSCRLRQAASQTGVVASTSTAVTFGSGSEEKDTVGWHNTASLTSRIVPTLTGLFAFSCKLVWAASTNIQYSSVILRKNGSNIETSGNVQFPSTGQNNVNHFGGSLYVEAEVTTPSSDYFEMYMFHQASGNQATNGGGGENAPTFTCRYLGPL